MLKDDKYLLQNTGKSDCKNSRPKEQDCNDMWIIFPLYQVLSLPIDSLHATMKLKWEWK